MTTNTGKPASKLGNLKATTLSDPLRHLFYGGEGVGKSTLAASAPSPIFLDCEGGSARIETVRYPFRDGPGGHIPESFAEVLGAVDDLLTSEHSFQTVVIDTVDALESLVWDHCCNKYSGQKDGVNKSGKKLHTIEDLPFGKGYVVAIDEWRTLCHALDRLRTRRGMSIVLLGHSVIRVYKNPAGEDYDRFQLRVHDKAAGFLKEWSDVVGFCAHDEWGKKGSDDLRAKGYSTGRRLIHLERNPAWDAKTRIPLPREIEMSLEDPWGPFAQAVDQGRSMDAAEIERLIAAELERIGDDDLTAKVNAAVKDAKGNTAKLSKYHSDLRSRPAAREAA